MRKIFVAAAVAWVALAGAAAKAAEPIHFAALGAIALEQVLPAPPAPGSLAAAADLAAVLQAQGWRTPEQVAWAEVVERYDYFAAFGAGNLLGADFSKEHRPALAALIKALDADQKATINERAKQLYPRPRPFLADARVQPVSKKPDSGSYPSGHATAAYVWAAVLGEIYPEQRAEILVRAERVAWGRVIGGVHFPSDLEGGRRLAAAVMAEEMKNAAFRAALEKCREEAAGAGLKKAA